MRRFRACWSLLLIVFVVPVFVIAQAPQTYSDVNEVEETGDLVGTELILSFTGKRVAGTLRHYEGTEPAPIAVTGRLDGTALVLSGSDPDGKVQITARLADNRIIGTLSFHLDRQTNTVELHLPRVERRRMEKAAVKAELLSVSGPAENDDLPSAQFFACSSSNLVAR